MKLVVVGGHSRNIGKTAVAAGLIAATRRLGWTALKITQFGHGICSTSGGACGCAVDDPEHPYAITRETEIQGGSDTSRLLRAGAREVYWVRTPMEQLDRAMPQLKRLLADRDYVVIESNSIVRFLDPDVYLSVLQYGVKDFKASSRLYLNRADAFVVTPSSQTEPAWSAVDSGVLRTRPLFAVSPPEYSSAEVVSFVLEKLQIHDSVASL